MWAEHLKEWLAELRMEYLPDDTADEGGRACPIGFQQQKSRGGGYLEVCCFDAHVRRCWRVYRWKQRSKNRYVEALTTVMAWAPSEYADVENETTKKNKTEKEWSIFTGVSHLKKNPNYQHILGRIE